MADIKVLYVEDEVFLARIVKESLESRNYDVYLETDGARALTAFRKFQPHICVLDVMLPGKDGFELAEDIRHSSAEVPIIFLTAKTQTEDVIRGFQLGGCDYIRKPFSMEELIVRIQHALKQINPALGVVQDVLTIGSMQFHINKQTLDLGGEEKKLSFREAELLKLLAGQKDQIISRKEILQVLWGNDSFFNSRNLDVYITKLRAHLAADPGVEIITIKGVGYRMIC